MYGEHGKPETYSRGKAAEAKALPILRAYFGSGKATVPGSIEDRNGTDIYVNRNGVKTSVDVKAIKKHAPAQILIEHQNVSGGPGWAHRSGIAAIFVAENELVLVDKKYLSLLIKDPRKIDWNQGATQQPREFVENYRPYGRPENNDLVVYVPLSQVLRLLTSVHLRWNPKTQTLTEVK